MLTQKMKQPFKTAQPVLFPPLADRAAWESLPGAARWAAAGQAALEHAQTAPELPLSLWLQFTRSGTAPSGSTPTLPAAARSARWPWPRP